MLMEGLQKGWADEQAQEPRLTLDQVRALDHLTGTPLPTRTLAERIVEREIEAEELTLP